MSENIVFSVIIPAYNEEKIIARCLQSVLDQRTDFLFEVIVVNNNSTDKTGELARNFLVKVIDESVPGVGSARRTGTAAAVGKYILNIDADTILPLDYLEQAFKRFETDPKLVCLGGQIIFYDAPRHLQITRAIGHRVLKWFAFLASRGRIGPMGSNMSFRRDAYLKTTGFDASLKFGEDGNLSQKLSYIGRVRLDLSLKAYVSSRRFRSKRGFFTYALNFIRLCFTGRPFKNELAEHR